MVKDHSLAVPALATALAEILRKHHAQTDLSNVCANGLGWVISRERAYLAARIGVACPRATSDVPALKQWACGASLQRAAGLGTKEAMIMRN